MVVGSSSDVSLVLAGLSKADTAVVAAAAQEAFPQVFIADAGSLAAALNRKSAGEVELFVGGAMEAEAVARAMAATDAEELPRWGVVVQASPGLRGDVDVVSTGAWTPANVATALRSAAHRLVLRREVARLRGDIQTIARCFNHDFRSPVGCIMTTAQVIKEIEGEHMAEVVQPIVDCSHEMLGMLTELTTVLRAAVTPEQKKRVAMAEVVWTARQASEWEATKRGATIIEPDAWPEVNGVASWLQAIWARMIDNSVRQGGPTPRIELGWDAGKNEHRFWVCDHRGPVSVAEQEDMLVPFHLMFQESGTRALPFAVIQRLVALQGGRSGFEVRADGAACFFFTLPA